MLLKTDLSIVAELRFKLIVHKLQRVTLKLSFKCGLDVLYITISNVAQVYVMTIFEM